MAAREPTLCEHTFVTAQGSPLTKLRRGIARGDLRAARTAASDLSHADLDEAARLSKRFEVRSCPIATGHPACHESVSASRCAGSN